MAIYPDLTHGRLEAAIWIKNMPGLLKSKTNIFPFIQHEVRKRLILDFSTSLGQAAAAAQLQLRFWLSPNPGWALGLEPQLQLRSTSG